MLREGGESVGESRFKWQLTGVRDVCEDLQERKVTHLIKAAQLELFRQRSQCIIMGK